MKNFKNIFAALMVVSFIAIANVQFICAESPPPPTGGVYVSPQQQPSGGCQADAGKRCVVNGLLCKTSDNKGGKCTTLAMVTLSSTTYSCECVYDPLLLPITP